MLFLRSCQFDIRLFDFLQKNELMYNYTLKLKNLYINKTS